MPAHDPTVFRLVTVGTLVAILFLLTVVLAQLRKLLREADELKRLAEILVRGIDSTTQRLDQFIYLLQLMVGELKAIRTSLEIACQQLGTAGINLIRLKRAIVALRLVLIAVKAFVGQYAPVLEKMGLSDCIRELRAAAENVCIEASQSIRATPMLVHQN